MVKELVRSLIIVTVIHFNFTNIAFSNSKKIASINLCADQILYFLAESDQIASLTFLSENKNISYIYDKVFNYKKNRGTAEEIIFLNPDVVFSSQGTSRLTVITLKNLGYEVVDLPLTDSFKEITKQILIISKILNKEEQGKKIIFEMNLKLNEKLYDNYPMPKALFLSPNGFTGGSNTLIDDIIVYSGYQNAAALLGITGFKKVNLEQVIKIKPDLFVIGTSDNSMSRAQSFLDHPALKKMNFYSQKINISQKFYSCGGPYTVEVVKMLRLKKKDLNK